MAVQLTERAARAVQARQREADVAGWLLRVAVVGGGCNGLSYDLYFVPEPGAKDAVSDSFGLRVAVDEASAPLLDGTTIDLTDGRSPGFRFDNPRARRGCSCGASFEV
jgi:iron-sulfur cluster assembly protein